MSPTNLLGTPCKHCGHIDEVTHWNPPGNLALVDAEILVKIPAGTQTFSASGDEMCYFGVDTVVSAKRTHYLRDKHGNMEYLLDDGSLYTGKLYWTHP